MAVTFPITLINAQGKPDPTPTVELWTGLDVAPYYQAPKIGDFTNHLNGEFSIQVAVSAKYTVLVNSQVKEAWKNIRIQADDSSLADGEVTTQKLAPGAVTNDKIAPGAVSTDKTDFLNPYTGG